jgi:[CysO sulfur-carrier protein]-S-L-cysteine hydrolase
MIDEIVEHARVTAPDECCGIIATKDRRATKLYRANNAEASPFRFVIDSKDQIRINSEIEDQGWDLGAIYHSHTRSAAYPSQTDVNFAASWPGVVWVIVSLENPDKPDVRSFAIENGEIEEISLETD